jgi:uncharacterized protein (TIGR03086 family)
MADTTQQPDLLALYRQASNWALDKVREAQTQLDAETPCAGWDLRTLMNHMLETHDYFIDTAEGAESASPPGDTPPTNRLGDNPVQDFSDTRERTLSAFGVEGAIEKTGPSLGIAFADQLLHGWDIAKATGQDTTMPDGLAQAAYDLVHGAFTDEQRKGTFGPEVEPSDGASVQDKLLAYTGRDPSQ